MSESEERYEYHCNICHGYDGSETGMILHFIDKHPREWALTEEHLNDPDYSYE